MSFSKAIACGRGGAEKQSEKSEEIAGQGGEPVPASRLCCALLAAVPAPRNGSHPSTKTQKTVPGSWLGPVG